MFSVRFKESAQMENDAEKVQEFRTQLDELEERAKVLDERRTNSISGIRLEKVLGVLLNWGEVGCGGGVTSTSGIRLEKVLGVRLSMFMWGCDRHGAVCGFYML